LSYVAPEILMRKPYNKKIDIWSLGVILYLLSYGALPFNSEKSENEEAIAKMIIYYEIDCTKGSVKRHEEIESLVKKCLEKNPDKRIDINHIVNNEWFSNNHVK